MKRATHCKRGHPFDDANTHLKKNGTRACRACHRERARSYYQPRVRQITDPAARFWAKVDGGDVETCWRWQAQLSRDGYGMFRLSRPRTRIYAHRWSYEQLVGPVPEGLELDHLCRIKDCVNPWHLEAVTTRENLRRARLAKRLGVAS